MAFDTDELPGLKQWVHRMSGKAVTYNPPVSQEWYAQNHLAWDKRVMLQLFAQHKDEVMFVCGSSYNDAQFYSLFDQIFFLVVDEKTILARLRSRTGEHFGKNESELAEILKWHRIIDYKALAAANRGHILDAARPIAEIVDKILAITYEHR